MELIDRLKSVTTYELGGGDQPWFRPNVDVRPGPNVDYVANFEESLPFSDNDLPAIFSRFVIEHLSWRKVKPFIAELYRVLDEGGLLVIITANTEAQLEWCKTDRYKAQERDEFWGKSTCLFGDQDYPENTHKNFMSPTILAALLRDAGFEVEGVSAYGDEQTDMLVVANKPKKVSKMEILEGFTAANGLGEAVPQPLPEKIVAAVANSVERPEYKPRQLYDHHYFNGGSAVGGYAFEGYRDFKVHELTANHILSRFPKSVIELGCARGYILKKIAAKTLNDKKEHIPVLGVEASKHCYLTRVIDSVVNCPIEDFDWEGEADAVDRDGLVADFAYSVAFFEHLPEDILPKVLTNMAKYTNRGLHGIDFGGHDDGFDKTHYTLRSKEWWRAIFDQYGLQSHEIVDKEVLERGDYPPDFLTGDGKVKLNIGSFTTMFYNGWINIDAIDLGQFAHQNQYRFIHRDVRYGLPFNTASVDMIFSHHFMEHLSYDEVVTFLRECRRVLKPGAHLRIVVPDAEQLFDAHDREIEGYDELLPVEQRNWSIVRKRWNLLASNHLSAWNFDMLTAAVRDAGFSKMYPDSCEFNHVSDLQLIRETIEGLADISVAITAIA